MIENALSAILAIDYVKYGKYSGLDYATNHHQSSIDRSAGASLVTPVESVGGVARGAARPKLLVYRTPPCQYAGHPRYPVPLCLQQKRTETEQ